MPFELGGLFVRESASRWSIRGNTKAGPISLSGIRDVNRSDGGGRWQGRVDVHIRTKEDLNYWRAVEALLDAGVEDFVLPSCETRTAPLFDRTQAFASVPFSEDVTFGDGTEFYLSNVIAASTAGAPYRATSLSMAFFSEETGGPLIGGETFSMCHPTKGYRRYVVGRPGLVNVGGAQAITFRPPLREEIEPNTTMDFVFPKCLVRLDVPNSMDLDLRDRKYAAPTLSFVEAP